MGYLPVMLFLIRQVYKISCHSVIPPNQLFFFFLDGGCFTLMGLFIGSGAFIGFFDGGEISN
jgi:hypothetical protein